MKISGRPAFSAARSPLEGGRSWQRLDGVDVLRGLSIFLVVVLHTNIRIRFAHTSLGQALPGWLDTALVWNGDNGVTIFFAVSGFLITSTAMRRWGSLRAIRVRQFYGLRFARIAPLLLGLLLVLSVLDLLHVPNFVVRQTSLLRAVAAVLSFHFNWLEGRLGYLPGNWDVLWSLSVEEAFYLFFPLLCVLLRTRGLVLLLLLFVAMGPCARTIWTAGRPVWQEKSYLGGMDAIALGCLTALVLHRYGSRLLRTPALLRTLQVLGIAIFALVLGSHWATGRLGLYRTGLDGSVLALGSCCLILPAAARPAAAGVWGATWRKPWAWLGRHSYEIYLTHMFAVTGAVAWWKQRGSPMGWTASAWYAAILAGAALLGAVLARWYTEPANRSLRARWKENPRELGAVEPAEEALSPQHSNSNAVDVRRPSPDG